MVQEGKNKGPNSPIRARFAFGSFGKELERSFALFPGGLFSSKRERTGKKELLLVVNDAEEDGDYVSAS
jgi:hypothetical protein